MGDHSSVEVDAVVRNTVTSQERRNGGGAPHICSWGKKEENYSTNIVKLHCFMDFTDMYTVHLHFTEYFFLFVDITVVLPEAFHCCCCIIIPKSEEKKYDCNNHGGINGAAQGGEIDLHC